MPKRTLTGVRQADDVTVTIASPSASSRVAGETAVDTGYSKVTGVPVQLRKRSSSWSQMNYGRRDADYYSGILGDNDQTIEKGDVLKVTASEQSPDPAVDDHLIVVGTYNHKGRVLRFDARYHDEFTENNEVS